MIKSHIYISDSKESLFGTCSKCGLTTHYKRSYITNSGKEIHYLACEVCNNQKLDVDKMFMPGKYHHSNFDFPYPYANEPRITVTNSAHSMWLDER